MYLAESCNGKYSLLITPVLITFVLITPVLMTSVLITSINQPIINMVLCARFKIRQSVLRRTDGLRRLQMMS